MSAGEERELDAIWAEHRADTAARLATLRRAAAAAVAGDLSDDLRRTGIAEAHALAGAAALFGFADGARLARELERCLTDGPLLREAAGIASLVDRLSLSLDRDRPDRSDEGGSVHSRKAGTPLRRKRR